LADQNNYLSSKAKILFTGWRLLFAESKIAVCNSLFLGKARPATMRGECGARSFLALPTFEDPNHDRAQECQGKEEL
jgi:hypothetical protein